MIGNGEPTAKIVPEGDAQLGAGLGQAEPNLDAVFLADSYGYRLGKSALDAVGGRESGAGRTTGFWDSTPISALDRPAPRSFEKSMAAAREATSTRGSTSWVRLSATVGEEFQAGSLFWSFTPAVSQATLTTMRETIRKTNLRNRTQTTLADVANEINPVLRGWIEYYGRYSPSARYPMFRHVNRSLVAWAMPEVQNALSGAQDPGWSLPRDHLTERPACSSQHWRRGTVGAFA